MSWITDPIKAVGDAINKAIIANNQKVEVINDLLPPCQFTRPEVSNGKIKAVVIHWIEGAGQTAKAARSWVGGQCDKAYLARFKVTQGRYGSAHDCVCLDGTAYAWIPQDEVAYSVGGVVTPKARKALGGNLNHHTVSIELCHPNWTGKPTPATYETAVRLAALRLRQHGLTENDLWLHSEITGKGIKESRPCHKWFYDNPKEWATFKERVREIL